MNYSSYGGESSDSLLERTKLFMEDLEKDMESKNIAIVSHGGTIRGILCYVLGMPLYTPKVKIDNCSVTTLEYKKGEWTLIHLNNRKEM
jgi:broad specificity phosphatase PhoE